MTVESIINNDPTLKKFIESPIDYKHFDWHIKLKSIAIMIAIKKYLDYNY